MRCSESQTHSAVHCRGDGQEGTAETKRKFSGKGDEVRARWEEKRIKKETHGQRHLPAALLLRFHMGLRARHTPCWRPPRPRPHTARVSLKSHGGLVFPSFMSPARVLKTEMN